MAIGKNIKGITIEFAGDTTKLGKAIGDIDKKTRSLDQQLKQVDRALKFNPGNTELLAQKQKLLGDKVQETKNRLEQLKAAQAKLDDDPAVDKTSQDYMELRREIIETESKLKHFEERLKGLNKVKFEQVGKRVQEVGDKMQAVGKGMTKYVTGPIVAGAAASVKAWDEVDAGLDVVTEKTGASGKALEGMQESVKNLAQEIPTDFETAGEAVGEVNTRFGVTGKELETLSGKFIKFAQLNDTDVSDSVDKVQKAMEAFGVPTEEAGGMLDVLNKVGQDTGISMDTLTESLVKNAPQLQAMGLTANGAATFLGQLETSGIDSSKALAGLNKAIVEGAKEGKTLPDVMDEIKTSIVDASSETDAMNAAVEIFGAKAGPAIATAARNGSLDFDALTASVTDAEGSLEKTFNETLDPADKFKLMLNSLKVTGYEIADSIFTMINPALEKLSGWLRDLAAKWQTLSPETQAFIIKAAGIAAALGPVLIVLGKLTSAIGSIITIIPKIVSGFGMIGKAFTALRAVLLANPWVLVAAAAIAAIVLIVKNWDKIKEFFSKLWEAIKVVAKAAWDGIKNMFRDVFGAIKQLITAYVTIWKKIITTAFNAIKAYFTFILNAYKTIFKTAFNLIKKYIVTPIKEAKDKVVETVDALRDKFSGVFASIKKNTVDKFNQIKAAITDPIKKAKDTIKKLVDKIKGFFDFDFKLPHIKVPHFSISPPGWSIGDLLDGVIPSLGIDWYAKGGIFRSPSVIGVGEGRSPEAVIPIDRLQEMLSAMADQIVEGIAQTSGSGEAVINTNIILDGKVVGRAVTPYVNTGLQSRAVIDRRNA